MWPNNAKETSVQLHSLLTINNNQWHFVKGNANRRAAELLAGALVQLIVRGNSEDVQQLIIQSNKWLTGEIKDPGCPDH